MCIDEPVGEQANGSYENRRKGKENKERKSPSDQSDRFSV
jgi:hypothetical protein